jgi:hypothetical protein
MRRKQEWVGGVAFYTRSAKHLAWYHTSLLCERGAELRKWRVSQNHFTAATWRRSHQYHFPSDLWADTRRTTQHAHRKHITLFQILSHQILSQNNFCIASTYDHFRYSSPENSFSKQFLYSYSNYDKDNQI